MHFSFEAEESRFERAKRAGQKGKFEHYSELDHLVHTAGSDASYLLVFYGFNEFRSLFVQCRPSEGVTVDPGQTNTGVNGTDSPSARVTEFSLRAL